MKLMESIQLQFLLSIAFHGWEPRYNAIAALILGALVSLVLAVYEAHWEKRKGK